MTNKTDRCGAAMPSISAFNMLRRQLAQQKHRALAISSAFFGNEPPAPLPTGFAASALGLTREDSE